MVEIERSKEGAEGLNVAKEPVKGRKSWEGTACCQDVCRRKIACLSFRRFLKIYYAIINSNSIK